MGTIKRVLGGVVKTDVDVREAVACRRAERWCGEGGRVAYECVVQACRRVSGPRPVRVCGAGVRRRVDVQNGWTEVLYFVMSHSFSVYLR